MSDRWKAAFIIFVGLAFVVPLARSGIVAAIINAAIWYGLLYMVYGGARLLAKARRGSK